MFAATGIKLVGILASMTRWRLLLAGQGIELPFRHIFGSFLIGRFIGTFLPSTAGLDGYKLYDAARFSGKTVEVTATTAIEGLGRGSAVRRDGKIVEIPMGSLARDVDFVFVAVTGWRTTGKRLRLKAPTLDAYASAFRHPLMDEARQLLGK